MSIVRLCQSTYSALACCATASQRHPWGPHRYRYRGPHRYGYRDPDDGGPGQLARSKTLRKTRQKETIYIKLIRDALLPSENVDATLTVWSMLGGMLLAGAKAREGWGGVAARRGACEEALTTSWKIRRARGGQVAGCGDAAHSLSCRRRKILQTECQCAMNHSEEQETNLRRDDRLQ
ncbi:hypothetical protein GGX14DRAFT_482529 [Mycena pura]|uniref:Uncharacterized protein n=1 Tax=Mycena pura TaxID=153505 RepID=A0AAD6UMX8_9AGAR|nr:hypothetical protein GGX14DRAFT_482529 [Mycena pura]